MQKSQNRKEVVIEKSIKELVAVLVMINWCLLAFVLREFDLGKGIKWFTKSETLCHRDQCLPHIRDGFNASEVAQARKSGTVGSLHVCRRAVLHTLYSTSLSSP